MASSLHNCDLPRLGGGLLAVIISIACGGGEDQPEDEATELIIEDQEPSDTAASWLTMRGGPGDPLGFSWETPLPQPYARPICVVDRVWKDPWVMGYHPRITGGTPLNGRPNYRQISGPWSVIFHLISQQAQRYLACRLEIVGDPVVVGFGISWLDSSGQRRYSSSQTVIRPKGNHTVEVAPLLTRSATATSIHSIVVTVAGGQGRGEVGLVGHITCEW